MAKRFIIDRKNLATLGMSPPNIESFGQLFEFVATQAAVAQTQSDIATAAADIAALEASLARARRDIATLPLLIEPRVPVSLDEIEDAIGDTLPEYIRDTIGATLTAGSNVTVTVDDAGNTIAIAATGGAGGGLTLISEVVTSSSATSVTVSSIPNTYRHLRLVVHGRGTQAATSIDVRLRFNGDSGANYDQEFAQGNNTTMAVLTDQARPSAYIGNIPASTATANYADGRTVEIYDYAGTVFQKSASWLGGLRRGTTAAHHFTEHGSLWWRSTAAITSITAFPSAGAFVDGSIVSLYGLS